MGRELSGNVTLTPGWSDRMQGKEDDKVEQFLNVKDLRRQTTANEEQLVISASANGNNQSGYSSNLECSSLISVMRQKVVVNFLHDNKENLYFQSYISADSTSHFYKQFFKFVSGKHDCHIRRCKTTEVVVGTETQDSHGHA